MRGIRNVFEERLSLLLPFPLLKQRHSIQFGGVQSSHLIPPIFFHEVH